MTSLQSNGHTESQRASGATVRPAELLVVVDGSERAGRVIEYALGLVPNGKQREIVLLGVVRQPDDARLRGYGSFKREQINAHLKDALGRRVHVRCRTALRPSGRSAQGPYRGWRSGRNHPARRQRRRLRPNSCSGRARRSRPTLVAQGYWLVGGHRCGTGGRASGGSGRCGEVTGSRCMRLRPRCRRIG